MAEWYIARDGQQVGPLSEDEIRRQVSAGLIGPNTLVWHAGMADWQPAQVVLGAARPVPTMPMPAPIPTAGPTPTITPTPMFAPGQMVGYAGRNYDNPTLTPRALEMLRLTKPWARLFSVLLFVGVGLAGIAAVSFAVFMGRFMGGVSACLGLVYLGIAMLYIAPAVFLGRYASRIGMLVNSRREDDLEAALEAQKSFWKFSGVLTTIVLGIYLLLFLFATAMRFH